MMGDKRKADYELRRNGRNREMCGNKERGDKGEGKSNMCMNKNELKRYE